MENNNLIQKTEDTNNELLVFSSKEGFELGMRMAKCLCASSIVPDTFRGDGNLGNCMIAIEMANRLRMSPLLIMQNLYIVHGNIGWSSKFLIACVNASGKFATPLRYQWVGEKGKDSWGCKAVATDKMGNVCIGTTVTMGMARKEKWTDKSGSKWLTMPELMLQYRAGAFFQRTYVPELSLGLMSAEEIADVDGSVVEAQLKSENLEMQEAIVVEENVETQKTEATTASGENNSEARNPKNPKNNTATQEPASDDDF